MRKKFFYLFMFFFMFILSSCGNQEEDLVKNKFDEAELVLKESFGVNGIHSVIYEDITLPKSIDGVSLTWISDKPLFLTNDGDVSQGDEDVQVILSYELSFDGKTRNGSFKVIVKARDESNKVYTITFDSKGGTSVPNILKEAGIIINKPIDPTKEGYNFIGWFLNELDDNPYIFTVMPKNDIKLYAKWEVKGIELQIDNEMLRWNNINGDKVSITILSNTFTTTGNHFELPENIKDGNNYIINFELNDYKEYLFYKNDLNNNMTAPNNLRVENNLLKWNWIGNEYRSNGFSINIDGEFLQDRYAPQLSLIELTEDLFETKTFEIAIYAKGNYQYKDSEIVYFSYTYEVLDYEVTLVYNDNSNNLVKINTERGMVSLPNPERHGYQFNGWYLSNNDGINLGEQWNSDKKVMSNITLYASWVENISGGGREVLSAPQVSTLSSGFIWRAIPKANGFEYRVRYSNKEEFSYWMITNNTEFPVEGNYTEIQIKSKGDGNLTIDSSIVTKVWIKSNYSVIGNVNINYDISVFYWDSLEKDFKIELRSKSDNILLDTQYSNQPEYIIPNYINVGEYILNINGINKNIKYQMLQEPIITSIKPDGEGIKIDWNEVLGADRYIITINDFQSSTVFSPNNYLILENRFLIEYDSLKISIKAISNSTEIFSSFVGIYQYDEMIKINLLDEDNKLINNMYVPKGTYLNPDLLPNIEKEGYRFNGWFLSNDSNDKYVRQIINEELTLYTNWVEGNSKYIVDLELNGGVGIKNIFAEYYEAITLPVPEREGFTFNGWYYDSLFNELITGNIIIEEDITLYANWIEGTWRFRDYLDGYEIYSFTSNEEVVYTPKEYLGKKVISIGNLALSNESSIKTLIVNENIQNMGVSVFGNNKLEVLITNQNKPSSWPNTWSNYDQKIFWSSKGLLINDDITYIVNSNSKNLSVKSYLGNKEDVVIPSMVDDYIVSTINEGAFSFRDNIKTIVLPDNIKVINARVFEGLTSLTNIVIPEGVTTIKEGAFKDNTSLENIILPSTLLSIEKYAFMNSVSLNNIIIPDGVTNIGIGAFNGLVSLEKISVPFTGEKRFATGSNGNLGFIFGDIEYSDSYYANGFYIPNSLKEVVITNTISIPSQAFRNLTSLKDISISKSVTDIAHSSFYNTSSLEKITLPFPGLKRLSSPINSHVGNIFGKNEFVGSYNANGYYVPLSLKSIIITDETSIASYTFSELSSVTEIILPNTVTNIYGRAFSGTDNLSTITIPSGLIEIRDETFYGATGLTNIVIPSSIKSIGRNAFYNTNSLTYISIPKSVSSLSEYAFYGASSIEEINFESDSQIKQIKQYTFGNMDSLTKINLPNINYIDSYAFSNAKELKELIIPDSVISIGEKILFGASKLEKIEMPHLTYNNVKNRFGYLFGESPFNNAYLASGYYIPSTLKEVTITKETIIVRYAFKNIVSLRNVNLLGKVTEIQLEAFNGTRNITKITVPDTVVSIGFQAFGGMGELVEITLPFIGNNLTATGSNSYFGYIFGNLSNQNYYLANGYQIPSSLEKVTITNSQTINESAFREVKNVKEIVLPNNLVRINDNAFNGMTNLSNIIIPKSVSYIGKYAFSNIKELEYIVIPNNVTTIETHAFYLTNNLIIYAETNSKLIGWHNYWNISNRPVYWGDSWEYDSFGKPQVK